MRKPAVTRDTVWLASADITCVLIALIGQVILARSLFATDYGMMIIILDAFATLMILVDAGLPTVLLRDGQNAPNAVRRAGRRILKLQAIIAIPFLLIGLGAGTLFWNDSIPLVLTGAAIATAQIAVRTHRAMLRVLGEARLEGMTKVVERAVTVGGYATLFLTGSNIAVHFASAFLLGSLVGLLFAMILVRIISLDSEEELDGIWLNNKTLLLGALPFAITLVFLPYVTRKEKFILAIFENYEQVALFHVAQLAWLAGLTIPHAMRAAILPVFGSSNDLEKEVANTRKLTLFLTPVGFLIGALLISILIPMVFPSEYSDGSLGANASAIFMILLSGWALTMLCVPEYTKLLAGDRPWRYTALHGLIVGVSTIAGLILIPFIGLVGAAWASVIGSATMYFFSHVLSNSKFDKNSITLAFTSFVCSLILYDFLK